ncbi:TPA: hypothetical protein ACMDRZ_002984 [Vibrio cholerae]|uniref:hypothetical protein n=1 Tax=Vibrio cholerae TaxID=666 RepID=UPI001584314C|nr:hypothetical protein [Vibrio cholerae]EKF9218907.1 hypothetical protein [Vibrio cholerae]
MQTKHPIQPLSEDKNGTIRFKSNKIVEFLLERGGFDMNDLACMEFSQEDREQFAQLIGYSLSGYGELSYVSDESYDAAENMVNGERNELEARNEALRKQMEQIKEGLRSAASAAFGVHPDDLG